MQQLRACTRRILQQVEDVTGRSVQFIRDEKLAVLATIHMARNGAPYHVLRYKPTDEPLDYVIAFQAGFVLRLYENEPAQRFDFVPADDAGTRVQPLLKAGQMLSADDQRSLPEFAGFVAQWVLMNLRSLPVGMRVDQWIASNYPELIDLQRNSTAFQQQQNMALLSYKLGRLTIPTALMGPIAAYALFADRLVGDGTFSIPFGAVGLQGQGAELMRIWDNTPADAGHDCELIDRWAAHIGLSGWYAWTPYLP